MQLRTSTVVLVVAAVCILGSIQLSCGVVNEKVACAADTCDPGPAGPEGPQGPAGPSGPSFAGCKWLYSECAPGVNVECVQLCPADTHPVSGSCDAAFNATLTENRASSGAPSFPPSPASPTAFDRWVCETSAGNMQFTYALCCPMS